jgi:hypothetical protein
LMLLRLKAMLFRRGFAEMKELPDLPAELGQVPVLPGRDRSPLFISYYDVL